MSELQPETAGPNASRFETSAGAPVATMTSAASDPNGTPLAGEEIHLPGGSFLPLGIAIGLTLILVGSTTDWLWTIIGGIGFLLCLGLWIRDTKREVDHLPDTLGSPSHH